MEQFGHDGQPMIIGGRLRDQVSGAWLLRLGVNTLKEEFHARLNVTAPGPGFCHWPCGPRGEDTRGYTEAYFRELVAEQRVLKYTKGGFVKYEWQKARMEYNEAFDLRCYARAGLEYLRVRLEMMSRDEIKGVNPRAIEEIETVEGGTVLNYEASKAPKTRGVEKRAATQMSGLGEEEESNLRPGGSAPATKPSGGSRYGSVTNAF